MKSTICLIVLSLIMVACEGNSVSKLPLPPQTSNPQLVPSTRPTTEPNQPQLITADFELKTTYFSPLLKLEFPHSENRGQWHVRGDDARQLFEGLQVVPGTLYADSLWAQGQYKSGAHVSCFKQAYLTDPENWIYSCYLNFNYRSGTVVQLLDPAQVVRETDDQDVADYEGINIVISSSTQTATFKLSGNDAMALFATLSLGAQEQTVDGDLVIAKAADFTCTRMQSTEEARCSVELQLDNGQLKTRAAN